MLSYFVVYIAGLIFALGLGISGMMLPQKVIGFLDVAGNWDPSLGLVMISSVSVYLILHPLVLKKSKPVLDTKFHVPTRTDIDRPLILGALLFGIGWGLVGLCPGPAITALMSGNTTVIMFFMAMVLGMYVEGSLDIASRMITENNDVVDA